MEIQKWSSYCGLGIIGACFRRQYQRPLHDENNHQEQPPVIFDTAHMGNECVIVKNGKRICGTGAALSNAQIVQDKSYFEVKIQSSGDWAIGVANVTCNLSKLPLGEDATSWVLRSDGSLAHNGISHDKITTLPSEGEYLGCSFDHIELNFFLNGKPLHCPLTGIKGSVFPIVSVDDGCIIDANFDNFVYEPPAGYQKIMFEKSLL
ncbi:SPRY domain-containing protein 7-like [Rhopilema esculentum]|uniref:SPRY domain-containing protein 7-like n=1 Tax=Rhopilema esculentum TaxID=499914 RepID=UPI0031DCF85A